MRTLGRLVAAVALLVPVLVAGAAAEGTTRREWTAVEPVSSGPGFAYSPEVVVDAAGIATAVWEQDGSVWAAGRPSGGSWQPPVRLGSGSYPVVDADGMGNLTVAWLGPRRAVLAARLRVDHPERPWTTPAVLSRPVRRGVDGGATAPELDVGTNGVTAVVFAYGGDAGPYAGWEIRSANRAPHGSWRLTQLTAYRHGYQEPHVAVDPDGDVDVVFRKFRDLWAMRKPAGESWRRAVLVAHDAVGAAVEVGADGRAVAAWTHRVVGEMPKPVYTSQRVGRRAWAEPVRVSAAEGRAWSPDVAIADDGLVTIAWQRPPRAVEVVERQPDGSWGTPETLVAPPDGRFYDGPSLAVGPTGDAVLAWSRMEKVDGTWGVLLEATTRSEGSWTPVERITPYGEGEPREVATAVSPDGSGLLVWEHWPEGGPSVVLARWTALAQF